MQRIYLEINSVESKLLNIFCFKKYQVKHYFLVYTQTNSISDVQDEDELLKDIEKRQTIKKKNKQRGHTLFEQQELDDLLEN